MPQEQDLKLLKSDRTTEAEYVESIWSRKNLSVFLTSIELQVVAKDNALW